MPYKPTGKPPGRPKLAKPATEVAPKPAVVKPDHSEVPWRDHTANGELCKECWPAGWTGTATGLNCVHGVWTRKLFV